MDTKTMDRNILVRKRELIRPSKPLMSYPEKKPLALRTCIKNKPKAIIFKFQKLLLKPRYTLYINKNSLFS